MAWIKRNLFLFVGGLITLGLLAGGGFYLYGQYEEDVKATEELNAAAESLGAKVNRPVHPGNSKIDNIKATAEQVERVNAQVNGPARKFFSRLPQTNLIDSAKFQLALVTTIAELRKGATNSSVALPNQYAFSFATQERSLKFDPATLDMLSVQLEDVRAICQILYRAKVHKLDAVKRVAVTTNEPSDGADYLPKANYSIKTNEITGAITIPYQFEVVGHSAEIAQVLNGLTYAPQFFSVKFVHVAPVPAEEPADGSGTSTPQVGGMDAAMARRYGMMPGAGGPGRSPGMDPAMARRYGIGGGAGGRYGGRAPVMPQQAPQPGFDPNASAPPPPTPVPKESKLKLTFLVESVKLPAAEASK